MISINHLNFRYNFHRPPVFTDFSLEIGDGQIIGLLGKNGTGKSTLLYLICGLLYDKKHSVSIDGIPSHERRPETLQRLFIVPEEFELPPISIRQYAKTHSGFYPNFSEKVLEDTLREFELSPDIHLGSLSMGQKKKAYISFALAAQTDYLLLDEPTNGLDIPSKSQFRKVVASQMTEQRTIIISTHQVHDVEMLTDRVVLLTEDRLLLDASLNDIAERLRFEVRPVGADLSDALYIEPSIAGTLVVAPANGFSDTTTVNLELLFNALTQNPEVVKTLTQPS